MSKTNGKWVFCKHKERDTLEVPGGRREQGESIEETAKRELWEETGAIQYQIQPVCVYSVQNCTQNTLGEETFGMLYIAEIETFDSILHYEIEKLVITDTLVTNWTYPEIQPKLLEELKRRELIS